MTRNGALPEGWQEATIGEVSEVNPPKPKMRDLSGESRVLFVPMAALDDVSGHIVAAESRTLGEVRAKSYRTFTSGDVLFAKITPCMENGKAAVVPDIPTGLGFGSTEFHVLRPGPSVDRRYLWHFVRQEAYRKEAEHHMTGSVGQARVPKEFVEQSKIPIPPIEEQRRIAALLDEATTDGLSASAHLAAAKRTIERFRHAVLAAACSGRLTADWREAHPDTPNVERALASLTTSKKRRGSNEQPVDLDFPELPETYFVGALGDAAKLVEYGTSKRCDASPDQGVPVLRMGNIQDGQLDLQDLKYCLPDGEIERLMLEDGDLLFNRTNSPELVGKSAVFHASEPMSFASYLIRVRFAPDVALPDFVNYWINSAWGRAWARLAKTDGVSQSNINGSKLALMPLPFPPIEEQRIIVERASQMLRAADQIAQNIEKAEKRVEQSSQAVLARAFHGELIIATDA